MFVTFNNISSSNKVTLTADNRSYVINPESSAEVFFGSNTIEFMAQISPFEELTAAIDEMDSETKEYSFKDKILAKFVRKFAEKIDKMMLNVELNYAVTFNTSDRAVINLCEGVYSFCDGKFADFLELMPVMFSFCRAETDNGDIKVKDVILLNRKEYLKFFRNCLLFLNSGLFIIDWFFYIPSYLIFKFYSSKFYIRKTLTRLYCKTRDERARVLEEKEQTYEKEDKKGGCLLTVLKIAIFLLILGGLVFWANNEEYDVVLSEDLSTINCFEETYVRIDGELPEDAEKSFLESYFAFYPTDDGEYDSDRYYCNVYETPDGTRYIWLRDNGENGENDGKDYEETEKPMVYILCETKGE